MSKLNVDQKTILDLFSGKNTDFLIPDYQRPYAWEEKECETLWEDICQFAFPDDNYEAFNGSEEYFLGPIVTFKNSNNKMEVIDGQQRLTTLMLLLRAFYDRFQNPKDSKSIATVKNIERCIWKTDEFDSPDKDQLKIDSEVASDEDKNEFLEILRTGIVKKEMHSKYAQNYRYFLQKITEFANSYCGYAYYLPTRIMKNCILLPIEAESQDTALRIFSTLNDRGKPLSDADIFKSQLYKHYASTSRKDEFIQKWKVLEEKAENVFCPLTGTPMDELFARYMYYERAKQGIKNSSTEALRKFYEKNQYALLKQDYVFDNLQKLADFWEDVVNLNPDRFDNIEVRKDLSILYFAPNGIWTYFVSVYYMVNQNHWDNEKFAAFLDKTIAFIWGYAFKTPGVNALRTPIYAEMVNIINGRDINFEGFKFDLSALETQYDAYDFSNRRPLTKSMLAWWAFKNTDQELLPLEISFEIEHIFARNRYAIERSLQNKKNLECLGNKALLEKRINIRASDYRFQDKKRYYVGTSNKQGTLIKELQDLAHQEDFTEQDIENRNSKIKEAFENYLRTQNLLVA
jgi:uncharacterized protein with ParB-like and HNH nuclease domain